MTTVSEKVLDVLVIGIYEEYARIYSMITEYEDTAELGPITKEMIIQAHTDLQEAILFHQCHITGVKALLMEESFVSLNLRVSEVLGMSSPEPNTIFGLHDTISGKLYAKDYKPLSLQCFLKRSLCSQR
jgi:hypothetical protein